MSVRRCPAAAGLILAVTVFLGTAAMAQSSEFKQANARYEAGDFKAAEGLYKKVIAEAGPTAAIYYNLGNACFKQGKRAEALVYYRRAHRIAPRDKDLSWNLSVLRGSLQDRIEEPQANILFYGIKKALGLVSADEAGIAFTGCLFLLLVLTVLTVLIPVLKTWTRSVRFVAWILCLTTGLILFYKWQATKDPRVVVMADEVYAHYGPSDKETRAFLLHEGAEAKVLDEAKGWYYLVLRNKNTGWVPKDSCQIV